MQRGSEDHSATATAKLRQISGPGPSAPLLSFKGSEPGQLRVCLSWMGGYTPGRTHSTVEYKPQPLGENLCHCPFWWREWGAHRVRDGGSGAHVLQWPSLGVVTAPSLLLRG